MGNACLECIISVCDLRMNNHLPCRNCEYTGKICDRIKHKYIVSKPYEILDRKEQNERMNIYND